MDSITKRSWGKFALVLALTAAIAAAVWAFYGTELGASLRHKDVVRQWIEARPTIATLVFVIVYGITGTLALPVWWLQIIAGYCFGLVMGLVWCHVGAVVSSVLSVSLTQWLVGSWVQRRIEAYRGRLLSLDERLGHNGLLVVTAVRISHVMPFGISNYLFGLTRIRLTDVVVGTILGGTLSKMIHIALGVDPHLLASPQFIGILVGVNAVLLSPLIWRYWRRPSAHSPATRPDACEMSS